jgi:Mg-chelatase subunit ChlD
MLSETISKLTPEALEFLRQRLENHSFSITYARFPVVFTEDRAAASEDEIFIPQPKTLDQGSLEYSYAMGIHESAHVLYSSIDFDRVETLAKREKMKPELAFDLFNIIEDYRVNTLIGVSHPGAGRIMDHVHRRLVMGHPPFLSAREALLPELSGYPYKAKLTAKEKEKLEKASDLIFGVVTDTKLNATIKILPEVYKIFQDEEGLCKGYAPPEESEGEGSEGEETESSEGGECEGGSSRSSGASGSSSSSDSSDCSDASCFGGHHRGESHPKLSKEEREERTEQAVKKLKKEVLKKSTPKEFAKKKTKKEDIDPKEFRDIKKVFEEVKKLQTKSSEKEMKKLGSMKSKEDALKGTKYCRSCSHTYAASKDVESYNACLTRHKRQIEKLVRDAKTAFLFSRGFHSGQRSGRLNGKKAYRLVTSGDQKIFKRKSENKNVGNIAVLLLVDNSGSMHGDRIDGARQASIVLHEVFRKLKVKHMIVGYSADISGSMSTDHTVFKYWGDSLPAHNLSEMHARLENRDGPSIRMGISYFDDVSEQKKLMIIVSDGYPCASDYGGKPALVDTVRAHKEAKRKNIKIINIGIGVGYTLPKEYENRVKVDNVKELPKAFLKVLRKEML